MATFAALQAEISRILDIDAAELADEELLALDNYLTDLGTLESDKIDSFAGFIRAEQARADFIAAEAKKLTAKAKTIEKNIDNIKEHYVNVMATNNLPRVTGKLYALSLRKSERVSVLLAPEDLPEEYQRVKTTVEADKKAIVAAIKAGEKVVGCFVVEGVSLQIK